MIWRYGLVGISCLFFSACATRETELERQSKIPLESARADNHGIVFLTLGTQQPQAFAHVSLAIRPLGQGGRTYDVDKTKRPHLHRAYFSYNGTDILRSADFSDANEEGGLFMSVLPPGDYEIFDLGFRWRTYSSSSLAYFSIPFRVNAGEAVYLGRFIGKLTGTKEKAELGGLFKFDAPEQAFMEMRSVVGADRVLLEKRTTKARGFKVIDSYAVICAKARYVRCVR